MMSLVIFHEVAWSVRWTKFVMESEKCFVWKRPRAVPPNRSSRVLVVDDNQNAAQALAAYLSLEGMDVRDAISCDEALRIVFGLVA